MLNVVPISPTCLPSGDQLVLCISEFVSVSFFGFRILANLHGICLVWDGQAQEDVHRPASAVLLPVARVSGMSRARNWPFVRSVRCVSFLNLLRC